MEVALSFFFVQDKVACANRRVRAGSAALHALVSERSCAQQEATLQPDDDLDELPDACLTLRLLSLCDTSEYDGSASGAYRDGGVELLIDNRGVVDISHDPGAVHARSKHIHRRHFYVRELVQSGEFKTTFVHGDDNLADIFTKPLDTRKFLHLRARLMNLPMPRA